MKDMISIIEVARILGMNPTTLRNQVIKGTTPFKSWAVKQPSGRWRYYIPRKPFEAWLYGNSADSVISQGI